MPNQQSALRFGKPLALRVVLRTQLHCLTLPLDHQCVRMLKREKTLFDHTLWSFRPQLMGTYQGMPQAQQMHPLTQTQKMVGG